MAIKESKFYIAECDICHKQVSSYEVYDYQVYDTVAEAVWAAKDQEWLVTLENNVMCEDCVYDDRLEYIYGEDRDQIPYFISERMGLDF